MKKFLLALAFLPALCLAQPKALTVKEFLKLSQEDTTSYLVSGVVQKVRSATSGSFYLQDATGTLLVYGLQDPAHPDRSFQKMDIISGDTLTVLGRFTVYGGSTLEMKDGRLVRKADGPSHGLSFYDRLDQKPSFKGKVGKEGLKAFQDWADKHVQRIEGQGAAYVMVKCVVGRNGGIQEVQALSGGSPEQRREAERVLRKSPKWKPAVSDGSPIRWPIHVMVQFK